MRAAETYRENPFFPYFRERLSALLDGAVSPLVGFSLNYLSQAITTLP